MSIIKGAFKKVQEIIGENKPTQDDYIAQAAQKYASQKDKAIADNTSEYAKTAETIKSLYQGSIEEAETKYDDLSRQNEVQKYINAREVAENNANLGLTDSGLNRTQQTAVQLSASNEEARIKRARQSGVDALVREMTVDLSENETNRANSEKAIKQYYEGLASSEGTAAYKADVEAETAKIKAQQDADDKKISAREALISTLNDAEVTDEHKEQMLYLYNTTYGYDENFLKAIGQSKSLYSGWTESMWVDYFTDILEKEGSERAMQESEILYEQGAIPEEYKGAVKDVVGENAAEAILREIKNGLKKQ